MYSNAPRVDIPPTNHRAIIKCMAILRRRWVTGSVNRWRRWFDGVNANHLIKTNSILAERANSERQIGRAHV